jgi:nucleotide-binding universal stress UspA family protein
MTNPSFRLLIATDESAPARAATEVAKRFPWPTATQATVVLVRSRQEHHDAAARAADAGQRRLSRVWKDVDVVVREGEPARSILAEAHARSVDALALGWRGHGPIGRLLMGSTSRAVLSKAAVPVLIARRIPPHSRRVVVAVDGSPTSDLAVAFLSRCRPNRRWTAVLVSSVVPMYTPRHGMLPSDLVKRVRSDVAANNARRRAAASAALLEATQQLRHAGWRVRAHIATGEPVRNVLHAAAEQHAELLVVGAGRTAATKGRLGTVAKGCLARCQVPVLVAR